LLDRVAKIKKAKQVANHAARRARENLQRQLNGQRNEDEISVELSDTETQPVRYRSIMGKTFLMGTKFLKLQASSSRMRYASTTGPASNQLRHGSNALDLCQS
jgi:hypothetical protein